MKEDLNNWLVAKANLPAAMAAGIVHPDKTAFTHFYSRSFATVLKENALPALADILRLLGAHQLASSQVRLMFQNAYVYGSARADGACAFIITSRNLSTDDVALLENFGAEFQSVTAKPAA
jgi:hypothetical protein